MTRHITDQPKPTRASKRALVTLRSIQKQDGKLHHANSLDRPRQSGNGRLVQYLEIERGRDV
jgi:hypothetical protein